MCRKRQPPAQARTEFPQWMVGTDIDGRLPVTLEMDPKSKVGMGLELMKLINFLEECSGCRVFTCRCILGASTEVPGRGSFPISANVRLLGV